MVNVKFEAVPEFNKELKKLSKKYKLLNGDFEKFRTVLTKKLHGAPNLFILSPNIISFIGVALEGVIRYRKPQTRNSINNL